MSNFTFFPEHPGEDYRKSDPLFIVAMIMMWGLGIFTLLVCTPNTAERIFHQKYYFVVHQLQWSAVGFMGLMFFALVPMRAIKKMLPFIVIGSLILCLLTFVPGIGLGEETGTHRWITIKKFSLQPSEFAKFAVILFLANLFDKYLKTSAPDPHNYLYPLIGLLIFGSIVFAQKDFSTGVLIFSVGIVMFLVSGMSMKWFLPIFALAIPMVVYLVCSQEYRLRRIIAFFHPEENRLTTGFQAFTAQRAIREGGLWGSGLGSGLEKVSSIAEVQTDYIFAGWASSMGLLGVTAYIALLMFFSWRGFKISFSSDNRFACYGAFGCTLLILLQAIMNIGVAGGAFPTTGIPLPFFSAGGSSLMVTCCMCGFIINASHCSSDDDIEEYGLEREKNV